MNRTQFNKVVVPGLFSFMEDGYTPIAGQKEEWRSLVEACGKVKPSKRAYEESAYYAGFGMVAGKGEGEPITYDELVQGPTKRWTPRTFALGCRITEELIEDSLYDDLPTEMESFTRELGISAKETLNTLTFDVFNSGGATTSHTAGDGLAVFSGAHTLLRGGTWSNLISPASDLSATTLQTALDNFENQKDDTGKWARNKAKTILVNPSNVWKAKELLNSAYDPESANNAINVLKSRNLQLMESPYYTDTDAFTLMSEPPHANAGVIAIYRRKITFAKDGDFETGDALFKVTFRYVVEINRPSNLYHSAGA
jgi:hypothetical protein